MKNFYPIANSEWSHLPSSLRDTSVREIVAIPIGEVRFPKKGEWFLSGSIVEAYYAKNDITSMKYPIAKLGKKITKITETAVPFVFAQ